jgi:hypothetical protein
MLSGEIKKVIDILEKGGGVIKKKEEGRWKKEDGRWKIEEC